MPAPREVPPQIPTPRANARMQKPQGGGKFLVQIPGGVRGGMVMDEIDTCIRIKTIPKEYYLLEYNTAFSRCGLKALHSSHLVRW